MKVEKLLTDNGSQFTDRFTSKTKAPTGKHAFDRVGRRWATYHLGADQTSVVAEQRWAFLPCPRWIFLPMAIMPPAG